MIYSKFLRSLKYGNDWFRMVDKDAYFTVYHAFIGTLLARENALVRLAVLSDDHDIVLGWSLSEPNVLHYVYVNHEYRKTGISKALCPGPIGVVTHMTAKGAILFKKMNKAKFNPWS